MAARRPSLKVHPWGWVGSLYFAEAVPLGMASAFLLLLLQTLGYSNTSATFWCGVVTLPWMLKPLWTPLLDVFATKRRWIVAFEAATAVLLGGAAFALLAPDPLFVLVALFLGVAIASASHDAAADGFYIDGLSQPDQALYCGYRSTLYRVGMIAVGGWLVTLIGFLYEHVFPERVPAAWAVGTGLAGATMLGLAVWHWFALPRPAGDARSGGGGRRVKAVFGELAAAFVTFFRKPGVWRAVAFILLFRLAEAPLGQVSKLFLRASSSDGGLALGDKYFGFFYGTVGPIALVAGGMISGGLVYRFGLGRMILPLALALNVPDLVYVALAYWQPDHILVIGGAIAVEQFGYGLGFTAFTLFMVAFVEDSGRFKTSHFAFMTGFMALGLHLPGMAAGAACDWLGYLSFFWLVMGLTVPATLAVWLIKPLYARDFGKK